MLPQPFLPALRLLLSNDMTPNQHEQEQADQKSIEILAQAVTKAINDSKGDSRFIDLSRIPLICLSITNIGKDISEIKDMIASNRKESDAQHESFVKKGGEYLLIRSIVFGGVALVLLAFAKVVVDAIIK